MLYGWIESGIYWAKRLKICQNNLLNWSNNKWWMRNSDSSCCEEFWLKLLWEIRLKLLILFLFIFCIILSEILTSLLFVLQDLCVDRDRELISKRLSHGPVRREENEEETNVRWVEKSDRSEKTDVEKNSIKQELNRSSEYLSDSKSKSNSLDRSHSLPWKRKEILTFDIPVHDTEKAGLGVSVKGKTSANHSGKKNGKFKKKMSLFSELNDWFVVWNCVLVTDNWI